MEGRGRGRRDGGEREGKGEGKGVMEGEGKGLNEGMWCWASSPCLSRRSLRRSRRISPLLTCLRVPPWSCPRSLLVPCPRRRVVVLCCCPASFLHLVVARNKQRRTMTNVVVRRLVPDVSELGWDEVGMGGAYRGFVSSFVVWVPRRCRRRGTRFPLVGAGGFCGGGSRFLCVWASVRVRFGAYIVVWVVGR